jgi:hypothetical protein
MPFVVTDLVQSKKFVFTALVSAVLGVLAYFSILPKDQVVTILTILWPTYLGAQGVADISAKLAAGRVEQEEMHQARMTARDTKLQDILQGAIPAFMQVMQATTTRVQHSDKPASDHDVAAMAESFLQTFNSEQFAKVLNSNDLTQEQKNILVDMVNFFMLRSAHGDPAHPTADRSAVDRQSTADRSAVDRTTTDSAGFPTPKSTQAADPTADRAAVDRGTAA